MQNAAEQEDERKRFTAAAEDVAYTLVRQVQTSASSVYTLASMVQIDGGKWLSANFEPIATTILTKYRGISNMDIAPFAVVISKVPLRGNEGAIGHAMFSDYRRVEATVNTVKARKILFDGPLKLIQGGTAVIARYPVFTAFSPARIPDIRSWWKNWNHTCCNTSLPLPGYGAESLPGEVDSQGNQTYFWGLVEFVSMVDKLVEDLQLSRVAEKMSFQFRNRNKHPSMDTPVFAYSPDASPSRELLDPVVVPITLPELTIDWEFVALPKDGWSRATPLFIVAMISVYGGFVVSVTSILLMESKSLQIYSAKQLLLSRVKVVRELTCSMGISESVRGDESPKKGLALRDVSEAEIMQ